MVGQVSVITTWGGRFWILGPSKMFRTPDEEHEEIVVVKAAIVFFFLYIRDRSCMLYAHEPPSSPQENVYVGGLGCPPERDGQINVDRVNVTSKTATYLTSC